MGKKKVNAKKNTSNPEVPASIEVNLTAILDGNTLSGVDKELS
jgi:hypothetical protein